MSCGNCGRQNPPSALYCLDCGQKLREPASQPMPAPAMPPAVAPAPMVAPAPPSPPSPPSVASAPASAARPGVELCQRCGVDNPTGMRFCRMCGGLMAAAAASAPAPQPPAPPAACPRCRAPVDRGAAFCGVCGLPATDMMPAVVLPKQDAPPPAPAPAPFAPPAPAPFAPPAAAPAPVPTPAFAPAAASSSLPGSNGTSAAAAPAPAPAAPPQAAPRVELRAEAALEAGAAVARLVTILKDGSEGPSYRVGSGTTDIGRLEGNVLLADDPYLSPRHARISVRNGRFFLRDLGSVNGIFSRVREPVPLQNGDVILVGQQVLKLELLGDGESSLGPVMHYGVMVFGTPELPRVARLVQVTTEGVPRDIYHLHRDETVIGRESGDIVFTDDAFLSRRHAALKLDRAQRRVTVRDLGSSNGTLVQFRGEREVADGDVFRIGHHLFRFDVGARAGEGGAPPR